jgi:hypothetical protein
MSGPPRHAPNTANHAPNCVTLEVKPSDGRPLSANKDTSSLSITFLSSVRRLPAGNARPTDDLIQLYALECFLDRLVHSEFADTDNSPSRNNLQIVPHGLLERPRRLSVIDLINET